MTPNTLTALLSGAITGGGVSLASDLMKEARWQKAVLPALKNALLFGGLAGGSTYAGEKLLGEPDEDELGGHTNRGALGGALGGGLVGGTAGAIAGGLPFKAKTAASLAKEGLSAAEAADKASPVALRAFKAMAKSGPRGALVGGALGALGAGTAAAYLGADEGMQLDYLAALKREQDRKKMREEKMKEMGYV